MIVFFCSCSFNIIIIYCIFYGLCIDWTARFDLSFDWVFYCLCIDWNDLSCSTYDWDLSYAVLAVLSYILLVIHYLLNDYLFIIYCSSLAMSCNSIYSIHSTFYSSSLSSIISSLFLSLVLILSFGSINITFIIVILFGMLIFLVLWINDLIIENSFSFTQTEQFSLVYGIKIMILSEWMLFFACFWGEINFRLILNAWCLFFCFPLLSSNSFAIPYSNVILLLFSSLPIQAASIFYKIGLFNSSIEQLSQTISCGIVFLILQIKEFLYSYLSISDSMIGSIFYFTTGLHGAHVFFGLLSFWLILMLMVSQNSLFNA